MEERYAAARRATITAIASLFCENAEWRVLDWDDLRFVLAVARSGAALGAARTLGVNQTTVTRRLANIEEALGAELFVRRRSGYRLTALGERVAETAREVETAVAGLEAEMAARQRLISGSVRFTCPETIANHLLAPWLIDFRRDHPGVRIDVINTDSVLDIAKGEADVAFRAGIPPDGAGIVARRLPDRLWTAYCSRSYADAHGMPETPQAMREHALVGLEGTLARLPSTVWFERLVGADRIPIRCNSLSNLVQTVRAGLGIAVLPCSIGETQPELVRCFPPVPELNAQTWLILREDLRTAQHVRAFVDFLADRFAAEVQDRPPLAG